MVLKRISEWRKLPVALSELCIDTTLRCGQSFRWQKINDEWVCTLHGRILSLKQDSTHLHYKVTWPEQSLKGSPATQKLTPKAEDDTQALLHHYFSLDLDLANLYEQWSSVDPNFRKKAPTFTGVRMLNQDAWEALIAFICSSNNNITRISQMVHKLCKHYGPLIAHIDGVPFYDFPNPDDLTGNGVESNLRELGFGYRAKYIAETARIVAQEKPSNWLETLRNPDNPGFGSQLTPDASNSTYKEAHEALLALKGVGPKVADCVCLMGLGWGESVPVDTHVWQIAQRDYKFGKKAKTFNKAMYDAVGDHFRDLWGNYAGWAHSVLFTADLKAFSDKSLVKEETHGVSIKEELIETNGIVSPKKRKLVKTKTVTVKPEPGVEEIKLPTEKEGDAKRRRTRSRGRA
uniref:DNA-(apurinic or apyrimidinic site) lyase n=1 Tax=Bionectria ochroleuca TaxID=29856 RepID=A0A8H7TL01_BIOOC